MLKLGAIRTRKLRIFCWTENKIDTHQKMVKPIEPPAVLKPHISDIGMQPQVFYRQRQCQYEYDNHHKSLLTKLDVPPRPFIIIMINMIRFSLFPLPHLVHLLPILLWCPCCCCCCCCCCDCRHNNKITKLSGFLSSVSLVLSTSFQFCLPPSPP